MNPDDVNNLLLALTAVLVLMTGVVTWFGWQTVKESRKATTAIKETVKESNKAAEAARETVATVRELLTVARDTAESSAKSLAAADRTVAAAKELVAAARETIEVAERARAADERDRKVRQLRDVGQLAETLFWKAVRDSDPKPTLHGWRQIEHNYLDQALVGMHDELPKCVELTQANQPAHAMGAARDAREEVIQALKKLNAIP
jgi:hypothetical protein